MKKHEHEKEHKKHCSCDESCECGCQDGKECTCNGECKCGEECGCGCHNGKDCDCKKDHKCDCHDECDCDCCNDDCECGCCDDECDCGCYDEEMLESAKYLELAQRIQAEFENYKKRTASLEQDAKEKGIILAVEKFLPVIDSVDNAKKQVKDENIIKALDLINNQIIQSLQALKVERIEAVGKEFDPTLHNAIMTGSEQDKAEDEILEEYQAGFKLGSKVIRHSVVKVNK